MTQGGRIAEIFEKAELGDRRLSERAGRLTVALALRPDESFPKSLGSVAMLESAYRFFGNPSVSAEELLRPHFEETARLARSQECIRLIHDTSIFDFPGEEPREGLGPTKGRFGQGFYAHLTLAVGADAARPLVGPLGLTTWTRTRPRSEKNSAARRKARGAPIESARWLKQAIETEKLLSGHPVVHVMDREADSFSLLEGLAESKFVIRARHDRVIGQTKKRLMAAAADAEILLRRRVQLSRRAPAEFARTRQIHPPRETREATLCIGAVSVRIPRPEKSLSEKTFIEVNAVIVSERNPPPGEKPVEWLLLTNLEVGTSQEMGAVVDHYRGRWLIEEFFKALKTGCRVQERQLESLHSLTNMLALFIPIAATMLQLREASRLTPDAPARDVLSSRQIAILRAVAEKRLPQMPTCRDALRAIARLGGHLPQNGEPGWLTIARGFQELQTLERASGLLHKLEM